MSDTQKHKKPNVPNLRFPEFKGEWESCELGDIAKISKGAGISKDQRSADGNPCILYGELYTTYLTEIIDEVVSKTDLDSTGLVKSKANDIIIPASGETAIDISTARCVLQDDVLLGGDLNIIRLNDYDGRFFSYQLNGVRKNDIARIAHGVSIVHLHGNALSHIVVNYPPRHEQEKISSLLSLIDQRIAIQNKVIEKYESLIKAICRILFQKGRNRKLRISELGVYFATMNLSKGDLSNEGEECILYGELFTTYGRVVSQVKSRTNVVKGATRSRGNDLLFPASTTVDAISLIAPSAIIKEGVILGGDMFGIHISSENDNQYLSYLLYYCYRDLIAGYAQGSTIIHLHYNDIKNIQVAVHDLPVQRMISHLLRLIEDAKECHMNTIEQYVSQKNYCLQQLFI